MTGTAGNPALQGREDVKTTNSGHETGFFETVDTPNGPVRFPGPPAWFSRTPGRIAGPAPRLGEHTAEIMNEIGARSDGEAADGH